MPSTSRVRRPASARPLNPDAVVDAALVLIAHEGLEGLSMRSLGKALGVEAMSLYHWFPSKERLLDTIADRLIRRVELPPLPASAAQWRPWMIGIARAYRCMGLAHPRAFPLVAARRFLSPGAIVFIQAAIAASRIAGFDLRQAARLTRTVGACVNGIVLAEIAAPALGLPRNRDGAPVAPHTLDERDWHEVLRLFGRPALDGAFEYGLACLLDGAMQTLSIAPRARARRSLSSH